jgi:hypothetical protein
MGTATAGTRLKTSMDFKPSSLRGSSRFLKLACFGSALACAQVAMSAGGSNAAADTVTVLDKPLPPSSTDSVGDQPSPYHVYVSGHWTWRDGAYVWVGGAWELPPRSDAEWVGPRWEKRSEGYVLQEGHWVTGAPLGQTSAPDDEYAEAEVAPPPPEREVIVARPSPGYVWIGGYWSFRAGRHVWISGHWEEPPRTNVVWVEPRWERRGHHYVFIRGYWRDAYVPSRTTVVVGSEVCTPETIVIAPPPLRVQHHRPPPPSSVHVWVDGYWNRSCGNYVWIEGCWRIPPSGHHTWRAPRWEHHHGKYIMIEGRWH